MLLPGPMAKLDSGCHLSVDILTFQDGDTALIRAADEGHVDVVKVLLDAGANKDHQSEVTRVRCWREG